MLYLELSIIIITEIKLPNSIISIKFQIAKSIPYLLKIKSLLHIHFTQVANLVFSNQFLYLENL